MKRFFDLSLLLVIPLFLIGNFDAVENSTTPEYSEDAQEIYTLIDGRAAITLTEIQEALDVYQASEMSLVAPCDLPCYPVLPECCYSQDHFDAALNDFGCYVPAGECERPCLDFDGNRFVDILDLIFISSNFCGS